MYERILVPTDGGKHATAALKHALELAAVHDATVHACYVVDTTTNPLVVSKDEVRDALRKVGEDAAGQAFAEAKQIAEGYDADIRTETWEGDPGEEIIDAVTATGADLVVLGTHGHESVSKRLLGSVTEQVVRDSPVPVLTIHAESE